MTVTPARAGNNPASVPGYHQAFVTDEPEESTLREGSESPSEFWPQYEQPSSRPSSTNTFVAVNEATTHAPTHLDLPSPTTTFIQSEMHPQRGSQQKHRHRAGYPDRYTGTYYPTGVVPGGYYRDATGLHAAPWHYPSRSRPSHTQVAPEYHLVPPSNHRQNPPPGTHALEASAPEETAVAAFLKQTRVEEQEEINDLLIHVYDTIDAITAELAAVKRKLDGLIWTSVKR